MKTCVSVVVFCSFLSLPSYFVLVVFTVSLHRRTQHRATMGQSISFLDNTAVASAPNPLASPADDASACVEMEAMLHSPTPSELLRQQQQLSVDTAFAAADATSSKVVSVFCLEVSKPSLLHLRRVLETPVPDRTAAFHRMAKQSDGVLLNLPASTSLQTLQSFLLTQSRRPGQAERRRRSSSSSGMESSSALHVFALQEPTVTVESADGPVTVTREISADLLIPLSGSVELAALSRDQTVLAFAATTPSPACAVPAASSSSACVPATAEDTREVQQGEGAANSPSPSITPLRTVVLLYTRDTRFGFGAGVVLIAFCCAISTCIAASVFKRGYTAKKNNQQSSNANNCDLNYSGNDGVPANSYNGSNNNNNTQSYSYNGDCNNGNNGGYYNNLYASTGCDNNANSAAMNGYSVPPNACNNNNIGYNNTNTGGPFPGPTPL